MTLIGQAPQLQTRSWGSECKQSIQELLLGESAQAFRKQDETKGEWKRDVCVQFQMKSSHSLMSTGNVEAPSVPCLLSVNGLSYSPAAPVRHCLKETLGELQTVHWCEAALGSQEKSLKVGAENLRSIMWKNARVSGHSFLGLSWWNLLPAHRAQHLLVWTSLSTFFRSLLVLDPAVPPDSGLQTSVSWEWFPVCFLGQIPGTTQGCRYTVAFSLRLLQSVASRKRGSSLWKENSRSLQVKL